MPLSYAKAKLTNAALRPVLDVLRSGLPRLVIETGQEPLILTFRRRGESLSDASCAQRFEAKDDAIYRCCAIERGGLPGMRWTSYAAPAELAQRLRQDLAHFTQGQLQDMLRDVAMQAERHLGIHSRTPESIPNPPLSAALVRRKRLARQAKWQPNNARFIPRLPDQAS
ncbi:MAG: hypothetical protein ACLP7P_02250 [Rhodomicrobium sp.]